MRGNPYNAAHLKGWAMRILTFKGGLDFLDPFEMAPCQIRDFWRGLTFGPKMALAGAQGHLRGQKSLKKA